MLDVKKCFQCRMSVQATAREVDIQICKRNVAIKKEVLFIFLHLFYTLVVSTSFGQNVRTFLGTITCAFNFIDHGSNHFTNGTCARQSSNVFGFNIQTALNFT